MHTPTTPRELRDSLEQLIDSADENGIDVDATWFIRDEDDSVQWVVDIAPGPESRETTGAGPPGSGA